jgi:pimeloyl-ACP methyl ester carboxylesterase
MELSYFTSFDGTEICYHEVGKGTPIVIANGLGGSFPAWKYIVDEYKDRYTLYSWDYRGLFDSKKPENTNITIEDQVNDLKTLLKLKNIENAIFIGWSYGAQVVIELYKQHPEYFRGIVLLNPLVGNVLNGSFLPDILNPVMNKIFSLWEPMWKLLNPLANRAVKSGIFISIVKSTGLVGTNLDTDVFETIASRFINLDHDIFRKTIKSSQKYDGDPILEKILIPVLMISGTRDFIVLPSMSRKTAKSIKNCKLVMVPKTSHYTAIEDPEIVIKEINLYISELETVQQ